MAAIDHVTKHQSKSDESILINNRAQLDNGHLQWSSWTQRRLMRIGAPIAAIVGVLLFSGAITINNSSVFYTPKTIELDGFSSASVVYFSTIISPV